MKRRTSTKASPAPASEPRTADRPVAMTHGETRSANARIVSLPDPPKAPVASKAGEYRVIHGRVVVPKPDAELAIAKKNGFPLTISAGEGAVVWLDHEDAVRMLDASIVEPLHTSPSRVGKIFSPPKVIRNLNEALGAAAGL